MKRSSSSHSDSHTSLDSHHSPLRFHSPLRSDQGDPPESTPYESPMASPDKTDNSKPIIPTHFSPVLTPLPPLENPPERKTQQQQPSMVFNLAVKEEPAVSATKVGPVGGEEGRLETGRSVVKREELSKMVELGLRISEMVLCLISFSVMAANKTQGWSGDSFDRYIEYRYCLAVNVIGFAYSGFQAYDVAYYLATGKHVLRHHLRRQFNFFMDQILAYLLISSSSSAATRVDDWQSNWGKDDFTVMATASVTMAFLAFFAFALSSLVSAYNLFTT